MIIFGLGGCASDTQTLRLPQVQTLFKSQHCDLSTTSPKLTWLSDSAQWETYRQKLATDPRVKFDDSFKLPAGESLNGVLIVSLGIKTSGGYDLELGSSGSFIEITQEENRAVHTLVIPVVLTEPTPGSSRIMVMTQPCMGLAIVSENESKNDVDYLKVISLPNSIFERINIK